MLRKGPFPSASKDTFLNWLGDRRGTGRIQVEDYQWQEGAYCQLVGLSTENQENMVS
jgi:hypothetical protein